MPIERPYARARTTPGETHDPEPGEQHRPRPGEDGPAPGAIDIWRVDLEAIASAEVEDLLDAGERARAARIVRAEQRALWIRSRGALRALLGRCLERDPRALAFETGPHGKPALALRRGEYGPGAGGAQREGMDRELRFSLSHSGALMLVAVSVGREVGVDVELARARYPADFLRVWTRREAVAKCLGTGLGGSGGAADGRAGDARDGRTGEAREGRTGDAREGWPSGVRQDDPGTAPWTTELDAGPGAFAALAVTQPPPASQRSAPAS